MSRIEPINTARCERRTDDHINVDSLLATSAERYRLSPEGMAPTAWDRNLRRPVDVRHTEDDDRLHRSRLAARLEHPNILPIHDLATADDNIVCVMRRMNGETLADAIAQNAASIDNPTQLLFRLESICDALAYAHDQGVAHTRLSPSTILLGRFGEVIVTGWLDGKQRKACSEAEWQQAVESDIRGLGDILKAVLTTGFTSDSLIAVCHRALGKSPYNTATQFGDELRRYRNGYPTLAEQAGFLRALTLFIARHRRIAVAAVSAIACIVLACIGYGRLLNRQTAALHDARRQLEIAIKQENAASVEAEGARKLLRKQGPVLVELAQHCISRGQFDRARKLIDQALFLDDKLASAHRVLGNWHQTKGNHEQAARAYAQAVELDPSDQAAGQGLELSRKILQRQELTGAEYADLAGYMVQWQRESEACRLMDRFEPDLDLLKNACGGMLGDRYGGLLVDWSAQGKQFLGVATASGRADVTEGLQRLSASNVARHVRRVSLRSAQGLYSINKLAAMPCKEVDVCFTDVIDLSPLTGKQLWMAGFAFTDVNDTWPLAGQRLIAVDATGCSGLSDIEPLRGAPLINLSANNAPIDDLEPLADAGFRQFVNHCGLCLRGCRVFDLRPLRGMVMKDLFLDETAIEDITPLRDVEMTELWISKTRVRDLSPLANQKKLRKLIITNCTAITDLSPLKNIKSLRFIRLESTGVTDLSPLADLRLQAIGFSPEKITKGMDALRNMKTLKRICITPQGWGMMYQRTPWIPVKKFWTDYDSKHGEP